jgi:hypothetical protein
MRKISVLTAFLVFVLAHAAAELVRFRRWEDLTVEHIEIVQGYPGFLVGALAFGIAAVLTIALIDLLASRWRRIRVFISFQHEREKEATEAAKALSQHSIKPFLLAFEKREHDAVLKTVRRELKTCDILVAFPGPEQSFVDGEILTVSTQGKPVLIIRHESRTLPATAFRGYPVFHPEKLSSAHYTPLARFILYVSGHWRDALHNTHRAMAGSWKALAAMGAVAILFPIVATMVLNILSVFNSRIAIHMQVWLGIFVSGVATLIISFSAALFQFSKFRAMRVARQKALTPGLTYAILRRCVSNLERDQSMLECLEESPLVVGHADFP